MRREPSSPPRQLPGVGLAALTIVIVMRLIYLGLRPRRSVVLLRRNAPPRG